MVAKLLRNLTAVLLVATILMALMNDNGADARGSRRVVSKTTESHSSTQSGKTAPPTSGKRQKRKKTIKKTTKTIHTVKTSEKVVQKTTSSDFTTGGSRRGARRTKDTGPIEACQEPTLGNFDHLSQDEDDDNVPSPFVHKGTRTSIRNVQTNKRLRQVLGNYQNVMIWTTRTGVQSSDVDKVVEATSMLNESSHVLVHINCSESAKSKDLCKTMDLLPDSTKNGDNMKIAQFRHARFRKMVTPNPEAIPLGHSMMSYNEPDFWDSSMRQRVKNLRLFDDGSLQRFQKEAASKTLFLFLYSPWCKECKEMRNTILDLAESWQQIANKITIIGAMDIQDPLCHTTAKNHVILNEMSSVDNLSLIEAKREQWTDDEGHPLKHIYLTEPTILIHHKGRMGMRLVGKSAAGALIDWLQTHTSEGYKDHDSLASWHKSLWDIDAEVVHLGSLEDIQLLSQEPTPVICVFQTIFCTSCEDFKPLLKDLVKKSSHNKVKLAIMDCSVVELSDRCTRMGVDIVPQARIFPYGIGPCFFSTKESKCSSVRIAEETNSSAWIEQIKLILSEYDEPFALNTEGSRDDTCSTCSSDTPDLFKNSMAVREDSKVELLEEAELAPLLQEKKYTLLLYYAPWCTKCEEYSTVFVEAAASSTSNADVLFGALDCGTDEATSEMCMERNIDQIPSVLFFENGEFKYDVTNLNTKDAYTDFLADPHGYASKVLPTLPKAPTIKCNISELNCGIYIKLMDLEQDRKLLIDAKVKLERAQAELMSTAKQAETDRKRLLASSQDGGSESEQALAKKTDMIQDSEETFEEIYSKARAEAHKTEATVNDLLELTDMYKEALSQRLFRKPPGDTTSNNQDKGRRTNQQESEHQGQHASDQIDTSMLELVQDGKDPKGHQSKIRKWMRFTSGSLYSFVKPLGHDQVYAASLLNIGGSTSYIEEARYPASFSVVPPKRGFYSKVPPRRNIS
eukprot:m.198772 g.198772  ORF g.198772 m.198772 type:complete len:965 (+) comp15719_c0_seq5:2515-5409(+)